MQQCNPKEEQGINEIDTAEYSDEFPFKEEETEISVISTFHLTNKHRVIVCQQFERDLLTDL